MKLSLPTKSLASAMETLRPVFRTRSTLPLASCVCIEVYHGAPSIRAANTECEIKVALTDAETHGEGRFCVSGQTLDRIAQSGGEECTLVFEKSLQFKSGANTAKLPLADPTDFIEEDTSALEAFCNGEHAALAAMLKTVEPACSDDKSRYVMMGVALYGIIGKMGAAEGKFAMWGDMLGTGKRNIIIPREMVRSLLSILSESKDSSWQLVVRDDTPRKLVVECGSVRIATALIEGQHPISQLLTMMPKDAEKVKVKRQELTDAVKFIRGITVGQPNEPIMLEAQDGSLTLSAEAQDGSLTTSIPCTGKAKVRVAGQCFATILGITDAEDITLLIGDTKVGIDAGGKWALQQGLRP